MNKYLIKDRGEYKTFSTITEDFENLGDTITSTTFLNKGMTITEVNIALKFREKLLGSTPIVLAYNPTSEIKAVIYENGLLYGEIVTNITDIDFNKYYINNIRSITIGAEVGEKDSLYFLVSIDKGKTWLTHNTLSGWITVENDKDTIIDKGMTLDVINKLTDGQLTAISNTGYIRFLWYMKKGSLESPLKIKNIKLDYNTSI